MNKFKRDLDKEIGNRPRFTDPMKRKIMSEIKKDKKPSKSPESGFGLLKYATLFSILLAFTTVFLVFALNDDQNENGTLSTGNAVLTDSETVAEINVFTEYEPPLEELDLRNDAMDRGKHEYTQHPLLIDPLAFTTKEISRGDVVLYEAEFFQGMQKTIGRVVGLPGEEIEIAEGQLYINDQKLDTFYGRVHRLGYSSNDDYNEALTKGGATQNIDSMKEIFAQSTEKFQLGENQVFVVGDDWFRGSQHMLEASEIQGEVLGYIK